MVGGLWVNAIIAGFGWDLNHDLVDTCEWQNTPVQGGGSEGGEDALLGEQRARVTDILSPAAMTNAYYICHNVQVAL